MSELKVNKVTTLGGLPLDIPDGVKVTGVAISGTPSAGQVMTATSPTAAGWATPSGGGAGTVVNNTLTSTSTTEALSAAQGKVLQDGKQATLVAGTNISIIGNTISASAPDSTVIVNNLTTNDAGQALSAAQGVALKTLVDNKASTTEATTSVAGLQSSADKTKLDGIATAATANDTDANLKNRANHTGSQLAATISDFDTKVIDSVLTGLSTATSTAILATDSVLVASGKLQSQISLRAPIANPTFTGTVGGVTASMVGLGSVDNTPDTDKPVSVAQQLAIDAKQDVIGIPSAFTNRVLTNADNGDNLICASAQTATVNTGLITGFGCSFKGTIDFIGTAAVNDVRVTGAVNPWCALLQTGVNAYDVVGGKA